MLESTSGVLPLFTHTVSLTCVFFEPWELARRGPKLLTKDMMGLFRTFDAVTLRVAYAIFSSILPFIFSNKTSISCGTSSTPLRSGPKQFLKKDRAAVHYSDAQDSYWLCPAFETVGEVVPKRERPSVPTCDTYNVA